MVYNDTDPSAVKKILIHYKNYLTSLVALSYDTNLHFQLTFRDFYNNKTTTWHLKVVCAEEQTTAAASSIFLNILVVWTGIAYSY